MSTPHCPTVKADTCPCGGCARRRIEDRLRDSLAEALGCAPDEVAAAVWREGPSGRWIACALVSSLDDLRISVGAHTPEDAAQKVVAALTGMLSPGGAS